MFHPSTSAPGRAFHGIAVVRAAFVIALFGWGVGFYGPPVFLYAVVSRTGWPLALVSAAVTLHFLWGAAVVACLPRLHARWGLPAVTVAGTTALALGVAGWAHAAAPGRARRCSSALQRRSSCLPWRCCGAGAAQRPLPID